MAQPLLEVKHLVTQFRTKNGYVTAVDDVSFNVMPGETLGIVGESGCGKSVTSLSILQLLPTGIGKIAGGSVLFNGEDLTKKNNRELSHIRGKDIAMIFQDSMTSLNPVLTIGRQIEETIAVHSHASKQEIHQQALDILTKVGVSSPEQRLREYPHQLSGGMRQRVMIAMALSCNPSLLIADEPTTALDVTIQAQILELIADLQKKMGMAVILVTHDLGVIADMCDNIIVMYGGHICERGTADEIFYNSRHEYTKGLLRSIPNVNNMKQKLIPIAGTPINILNLPAGCAFCTRCDEAMKICLEQQPEEMVINDNHYASCWMNVKKELEKGGAQA